MTIYAITLFFLIALIVSIWHDKRSLLNPVLLVGLLVFGFIAVVNLLDEYGGDTAYTLSLGFMYVLLPLIIFGGGVFLIYNGIVLLKKEGFSKANLLSLLMGIVVVGFFGLIFLYIFLSGKIPYGKQYLWLSVPFLTIFFTYFIFGVAFVGYLLYSIMYSIFPRRTDYDFIIIHGAGLINGETVTPLLEKRILKAVEAFHRSTNPNVRIIASGGKGSDEKLSEAQAIANYLADHTDVPSDKVILEDKSATTYQNLMFSKRIAETYVEHPRYLFVTNDYHVFRTSTYAKKLNMDGDGLGCRTASYYVPSAFIREFVAICVRLKWIFIVIYLLYFALIVIFIIDAQSTEYIDDTTLTAVASAVA